MRMQPRISTSHIHFIISKTVSAVPADDTEVPTSRHKTSSTNGLAATGPQSGSNFKKFFFRKPMFSPPLWPEKYAESNGEIRFQIRSQSPEIFAFLWPPCLRYQIRRNTASTTIGAWPILCTGLRPVQLFLVSLCIWCTLLLSLSSVCSLYPSIEVPAWRWSFMVLVYLTFSDSRRTLDFLQTYRFKCPSPRLLLCCMLLIISVCRWSHCRRR